MNLVAIVRESQLAEHWPCAFVCLGSALLGIRTGIQVDAHRVGVCLLPSACPPEVTAHVLTFDCL